MTAAERIAEALEEHDSVWVEWPDRGWQCRCGATVESGTGLAKHQAEVIVGLPKIVVVGRPESVVPVPMIDAWAGMHRVCVSQLNMYVREYTPDEARQFAHRLLWLAEVADGIPTPREAKS